MSSKPKSDRCPLCGKPTDPAHKPFCSQGCRDRDLLNWLDEGYRVPGPPADPDLPSLEQDGLDSDRQPPL
jgi:endogenous inhibitor of DNA gyrase (YacG/DUF329 family)